jgi:hypothetical protein
MLIVGLLLLVAGGSSGTGSGSSSAKPDAGSPTTVDAAQMLFLAAVRSDLQTGPATSFSDVVLVNTGHAVCFSLNRYQAVSSRELNIASYVAQIGLRHDQAAAIRVLEWSIEYLCPQWRAARDAHLGSPLRHYPQTTAPTTTGAPGGPGDNGCPPGQTRAPNGLCGLSAHPGTGNGAGGTGIP